MHTQNDRKETPSVIPHRITTHPGKEPIQQPSSQGCRQGQQVSGQPAISRRNSIQEIVLAVNWPVINTDSIRRPPVYDINNIDWRTRAHPKRPRRQGSISQAARYRRDQSDTPSLVTDTALLVQQQCVAYTRDPASSDKYALFEPSVVQDSYSFLSP